MNVPTRILLITGDAGESYECLYARHRLLEAGYLPAVAAPSLRRLHLVIHDFEPGWDTYIERQGYGADADLTFDDVRVDDYAAVLVLGGRAPEYFRHDARVVEFHDVENLICRGHRCGLFPKYARGGSALLSPCSRPECRQCRECADERPPCALHFYPPWQRGRDSIRLADVLSALRVEIRNGKSTACVARKVRTDVYA